MQGKNTEKIVCYLRSDDELIKQHIEDDRAGGSSISSIIRESLYAYYSPTKTPEQQVTAGILRALTSLYDSLEKQAEEIGRINKKLKREEELEHEIARLRNANDRLSDLLHDAVYDKKARLEIKEVLDRS